MKTTFLLAFLFILSLCFAQNSLQGSSFDTGYLSFSDYFKTKNSLTTPSLDLSKLSVNHSLSFSSSFSSNKIAGYQSTYTNHLEYKFSKKLNFKLNLNFVNYGTSSFDNGFNLKSNNDNETTVLPEFNLEYKPTENTQINIIFERRRYNAFSPFYSPYRRY